MRAIRFHEFGPPQVLKLEQVPDPVPAEKQVLVRIKAIGVNPYETYIRSGGYAMKPPLPAILGNDAAGVIEKTGPGVECWRVGDRVYTIRCATGAYAELAVCDASCVYPLSERLSFAQGAAINVPYGTAYRAIFHRAQARPGEIMLVHGASGGVGIACVQMGVAAGLKVIGTAGTDAGLKLVRENGAHYVFNHNSAGCADEIARLASSGINVIIEMLANVNLDRDLAMLSKGGRVVIVGSRGRVEIDPRQTMGKEAAVLGMQLWAGGDAPVFEAHAAIGAGLRNGTLTPVVGLELPMTEAAQAHERIMLAPAHGKIVLVP